MDPQNIHFITWNVNGLKQNRDQKFQELQNADVVFLQETHIGEGDGSIIKDYKDKWFIFYTKYTSSSKGTAILVSKRLHFEHISHEKDNHGAYVVLKCKLAGQPYTLVSVYNHQTDTKTLDNLSRYLQSMTIGLLVIGGDFNVVLNKFIDKKWNTMTINNVQSKLLVFVEMFMKSLQLVDVWRRKNPVKQDFTFYVRDCPVSRLDYFFVPEECMWRVKSCKIIDSKINELKDHRPVSLKINNVFTPFQKDTIKGTIESVPQWLDLKEDLLTDKGLLLDAKSSHALSEVDIVSAVQSLQVSDTPRPDGIPVSFYKDNIEDLSPYIKTLFDRICRSAFNCSQKHFNETTKSDDSQSFFNVDYLIIATILAKRLDDAVQSLPNGRIPNNSAAVMMTPKTHCALLNLSHVKKELEHKRSNLTLNQNLLIIENLLSDSNKDFFDEKYNLLHQGCPLSSGLIILALKSYASQLFGHLEKHGVFIFKQSVIVCFQLEDLDRVKATVENSTNELYGMEILSRENGEPLQLNCLKDYFKDEDQDREAFVKNKAETSEHFSKADEIEVCEENEDESEMCQENESMEVNIRSKEESEDFHGMKNNTPPLLPVPSQYRAFGDGLSIHSTMTSQGIKRKRDHESSGTSTESFLTKDEDIIEYARQIMKRVSTNPDPMGKGYRNKATIGIFGKLGEGKSSLLSAILGKQDLLPSGCFDACTAVVTQVEANLTDSKYTAEIEFFSKEEWEQELQNLFREIENEDEDRNEDLIGIAEKKFTALYGTDAHKKTLEELKKDVKFAEIENFLSICKKTMLNSDASTFANDVARCPGDWYWPLVKSVRIKIPDCRDLLEHIVLVGIPGTGDCNKIRDDKWKSKLSECSSVWIVSDINRAVTDKDPWGILKHCIEELGPGGECKHINFICTKTDNINQGAYMRCARLHRDQISEEKDLKKVCILHRNEQAKAKIKEKFKNSQIKKIFSVDNDFQVLTVSSNAFFDHNLNLESNETEIPKLQDDLRSLNKSINRELTRNYVDKAKENLLLIQNDHLDKEKKMAQMKVKVCMEFEQNLMKALNELDRYFHDIYNDLEKRLSKGVEESVQLCVASTKGLIAPNKPINGFHKILSALCKNYGCYWSKNWDKVLDLNKTLGRHLHECIDEDFTQIFPVNGKTGKSVQEQIEKFSIIQSDCDPSFPILQHIHDYIKIKETQLKASLNRDIVDRKKDIYSSIQTTIVDGMTSCYEQAAAVKGQGSMKIKQDLLITTVDNNIKQETFRKSKMEVLKKFNDVKLHIMDTLEKELKKAIEHSQSHTGKNTWMDVSREIEELERLSELLYD